MNMMNKMNKKMMICEDNLLGRVFADGRSMWRRSQSSGREPGRRASCPRPTAQAWLGLVLPGLHGAGRLRPRETAHGNGGG